MNKKKIAIALITVIFLFVALSVSLIYIIFGAKEIVKNDINDWNTVQSDYSFLPSVDQLGEYTNVTHSKVERVYGPFCSETYTLRTTYSDSEFSKVKELIETKYSFQETVAIFGETMKEEKSFFILDGFAFKMLSSNEYNLHYPKEIIFIGISEEKNEIVYIVFYDPDLDYIDSSMDKFLIKECGWEK